MDLRHIFGFRCLIPVWLLRLIFGFGGLIPVSLLRVIYVNGGLFPVRVCKGYFWISWLPVEFGF
jgi:hypothetical protein